MLNEITSSLLAISGAIIFAWLYYTALPGKKKIELQLMLNKKRNKIFGI